MGFANETSIGKTTTWLTPPHIIKKLGKFDLDPCAALEKPGWTQCTIEYNITEDGLTQNWQGRVWLNPPYGRDMGEWLSKMKKHGNGIVFIFARTETRNFFDHIWEDADAILFLKGRVKFYRPDGSEGGTSNAPSVLIAYGEDNARALKNSCISGKYISLKSD